MRLLGRWWRDEGGESHILCETTWAVVTRRRSARVFFRTLCPPQAQGALSGISSARVFFRTPATPLRAQGGTLWYELRARLRSNPLPPTSSRDTLSGISSARVFVRTLRPPHKLKGALSGISSARVFFRILRHPTSSRAILWYKLRAGVISSSLLSPLPPPRRSSPRTHLKTLPCSGASLAVQPSRGWHKDGQLCVPSASRSTQSRLE